MRLRKWTVLKYKGAVMSLAPMHHTGKWFFTSEAANDYRNELVSSSSGTWFYEIAKRRVNGRYYAFGTSPLYGAKDPR